MKLKNITKPLIMTVFLLTSANLSANEFSEKDIDEMLEKLNYQETLKINTEINDPFSYKEPEIDEDEKKANDKKSQILNNNVQNTNIITNIQTPTPIPTKVVKKEKKVVVDYQGIIVNKAVINNKLFKKGDTFLGSKIVEIKPQYVLLKQNGFTFKIDRKKKINKK